MAKIGRPTKYKPKHCDKLIEFFDQEPYEDVEIDHYEKTKGKAGKVVVWTDSKRVANKLPTLRDFAKTINVHVSNVYEWLNENSTAFQKEFRDAFMCAKGIRRDFLIQNGLQGLYPPASFKFVAINLTDMVDQSDLTSGGEKIKAGAELSIPEMKKRIQEAESAGNGIPTE